VNSIDQLETDLWAAADNLRANSKLTSSEYCMPVLGVIFLRHARHRRRVQKERWRLDDDASFAGILTNGPRPLFGDARAPRHDAAPSQTA
jgi:hypothetical protein